jgi:hypothetical protein
MNPVATAVQINMYPMDVRHAEYLLPHQIRTWGDSVDRIVITLDTHRSRSGRYRGSNYQESLTRIRSLITDAQRSYPRLQIDEVDYSEETRRKVSRFFFGTDSIPFKAWDGGPFYSYFFGLYAANARYIMHFDGDMMFGGGSLQWIHEAIALMERQSDVLLVAPFPGPPRSDGEIFGHYAEGHPPARIADQSLSYRFTHASTRIFMIDMARYAEKVGAAPLLSPTPVQRIKSAILGNPPVTREAEIVLTGVLRRYGLYRIDMLGSEPGMWSLHPPYRGVDFYRRLPQLVREIETGNIPEAQRGHYDINDSMVDWSEARRLNRWHRRYYRLLRDRLAAAN